MTKSPLFRTLAVAALLSSLAGCGSTGLTGALASTNLLSSFGANGTASANADGQGRGHDHGGPRGQGGPGGQLDMFQTLSLTADQETQLQAIQAKYRPAKPSAPPSAAPGTDIKALLTAATLDTVALKAALLNRPAPPAKPAENRTAELVEIRAVLTDAQRAQLVTAFKAAPAPSAAPSPKADDRAQDATELATRLNLTTEQKAAFQAFQDKLAANRPAAPTGDRHAAEQAAMISFWESGDTTALAAARPPADATPPAFPADEFVAFAATLTVDQRTQLAASREGGMMGGPGGHGGPGGGGDHDGDGGRGGHGGPGGPGGDMAEAN